MGSHESVSSVTQNKLICKDHGTVMRAGHRRSKKTMQPRWIYDEQGATLLVQRTYNCKTTNNLSYCFLSGELSVAEQLPACIELPFRLSHRATFTVTLETDIVQRYVHFSHNLQFAKYLRTQKNP